jgi:chorismate synthase
MTFTFGRDFKIHVFGESHGSCIGATVEGCPPGLEIDKTKIQEDLDRRRPGQGHLVSARGESDRVTIESGLFGGKATGAPITMTIPNTDVDSSSYEEIRHTPRPGHADYTARIKYGGQNDYRGGGFFSGRMTAALVMAGGVAKQILHELGIDVIAHVIQIGHVRVGREIPDQEVKSSVYTSSVRCADLKTSNLMEDEITKVKHEGDSTGGVIECRILGVPVGIGEPFFDSIESVMSHAMFSIPGAKGIEFGSGFSGSAKLGSENNDPLAVVDGKVEFLKNDAGGILGGITNGQPIVFKVAFKPTPSISRVQRTVDLEKMENSEIQIKGRHDPCIVPRAVPVVECLAAVVIADLVQRNASVS